jgi:hypothetical protein
LVDVDIGEYEHEHEHVNEHEYGYDATSTHVAVTASAVGAHGALRQDESASRQAVWSAHPGGGMVSGIAGRLPESSQLYTP